MSTPLTILVMAVSILSACDVNDYPTQPEEDFDGVSMSMKVAIPASLAQIIERVEYTISADDMDTMVGGLSIEADSTARARVEGIKAGNDRIFTLNAYDSEGTLTHTGSATANITSGQTTTVLIQMGPLAGSADIEGTISSAPQTPQTPTSEITEVVEPFSFTLEKLEILPEKKVKFTFKITNLSEDRNILIRPDATTFMVDENGNFYPFLSASNAGATTITPDGPIRAFIICQNSDDSVSDAGSLFTISFIYDHWDENVFFEDIGVLFTDVRPS